jgi:hypothetical protein
LLAVECDLKWRLERLTDECADCSDGQPELEEKSDVSDSALGARHHRDWAINRLSGLRLHGIVNSGEGYTDSQPHPDDGVAVVNHHRAIATSRDNSHAATASYKCASASYKCATATATATATNRRLSPSQQ